jgi:hypothetical protein
MPNLSRADSDVDSEFDWLPAGVVRRRPSVRRGDTVLDQRCIRAAVEALREAPDGRVVAASRSVRSPWLTICPPERAVEVVEAGELVNPTTMAPGEVRPDLAACVLDGLLERVDRPVALLAEAWHRIVPGGLLILTLAAERKFDLGRRRSRHDDRTHLFPGQTLASLLFRAGFESPRFYRYGHDRLVVAWRSPLEPPPHRPVRLSIIMPVYNERGTFEKTMELVLAKELPGVDIEVIVVESNSTDGTRQEVLSYEGTPRVSLILEDSPRGKGRAVRRGLQAAQGDFILIQDADLEYDVDDYAKLIEPLRRGETGFVLGRRRSPDGAWGMRRFSRNTTALSHIMNLGHVVFLTLFNVVYQQRLHDPFTMYKVFRRDCLEGIELECDRFDFDWELTAKLIRAGYHPFEIPVSYQSRSFAEGKKVTLVRDPLTWIRACFLYRFSRLHRYD